MAGYTDSYDGGAGYYDYGTDVGVDPWGRPPGDPHYGLPPITPSAPTAAPAAPGPAPEAPTAPTGGAPASSGMASLLSMDDFSPTEFAWPEFNAPQFRYDQQFRAPSLEEAAAEPGYEFARREGLRAATNSASGRGVLRSGGTLRDLIGWGNNYAAQNYQQVFNRAKDTFATNYGVARDTFDRDYRGAYDEFQPKQRAAELTFEDLFRRWKASVDATLGTAQLGAGV